MIGHEKGFDTKTRIEHNFGMARPEGYRKAIRLMEFLTGEQAQEMYAEVNYEYPLLPTAEPSDLVAGWSSTVIIVSLLCGVNMVMTGIVGLYVGRIHAEVKRRPLYVVSDKIGFEQGQAEHARASVANE